MAAAKKTKGASKKKLRMIPLSRPCAPQDIIDRTRQYGPACVDALADVVANGEGSARVAAANSLLDRGYGKVGQRVEVSGSDGGPLQVQHGVSPAVQALIDAMRGEGAEENAG